jgi:rubrerythrin
MPTARPINTIPRFYAHAIAIEHEAAERYMEFAEHMKDHARDAARLFERLAHDGFSHARQLVTRADKVRLPALRPGAHAWLDKGTPLAAAHEWVFRLLSPRDALKVAMHAEQRAKRFFAHVVHTTRDKEVKALAEDFLLEEGEHIARMKRAIRKRPNPVIDWERIYDQGGPLGVSKESRPPAGAMLGRPGARRGPVAKKVVVATRPARGAAAVSRPGARPVRAPAVPRPGPAAKRKPR